MPRRGQTNLTEAALEAATSAYQAGESLDGLAERFHVAPKTLKAALVAAGVPIRSKGETCRLRALAQHSSELWSISGERWQEVYWSEERPSLSVLAGRFRVSIKHLRTVLLARGIRLRTAAEQLAIDGRKGRRKGVGRPGPFTAADYARHRETMEAGIRKRSENQEWRRNNGLAHRKKEERLCQWCGETVVRVPSLFRVPPERTYCCRSCANRHFHHNRQTPEEPRPLILGRLLAALDNGPATAERLERLAARVGARDPELLAVVTGKQWA